MAWCSVKAPGQLYLYKHVAYYAVLLALHSFGLAWLLYVID
jgi:hypothetical protein